MADRSSAAGFVEVRDEPRHRFCFENPYAHVYDVLLPPGDISLFHRHAEDTLYVAVVDVLNSAEELGGEENTYPVPCGSAVCRGHRRFPLIHRVTNLGENDMRLIGAEIIASPPHVSAVPLRSDGIRLEQQKARVRIYRIHLAPGCASGVSDWDFSGLMVCLTDAAVVLSGDGADVTITSAPGLALWHDGPVASRQIRNVGRSDFRAVLAEWL